MEARNVSSLMPRPFSQQHDGYLQRYHATNQAHILNIESEVIALHRERYVFPILLLVKKLPGQSLEPMFMAQITPVEPSANKTRCWIDNEGHIVCAENGFLDALGLTSASCIQVNFRDFCCDASEGKQIVYKASTVVTETQLSKQSSSRINELLSNVDKTKDSTNVVDGGPPLVLEEALRMKHRFFKEPVVMAVAA